MLRGQAGSNLKLNKMTIAVEIPSSLEITRAFYSSTCDAHIIDHDVAAAAFAAKDVVVPSFLGRSTCDVPHGDILDLDAIGRVTSWTAVEVILLDIDSVDGDILHADVFENDVGDETCGIGVRLDARAVLSVQDNGVGEEDVGDVVVCGEC